jgi:hypothetical protein
LDSLHDRFRLLTGGSRTDVEGMQISINDHPGEPKAAALFATVLKVTLSQGFSRESSDGSH